MRENLKYAQIPILYATSIVWEDVMEDSWESARWNSDQTEVLIHWAGDNPVSVDKVLSASGRTAKSHSVEYDYINKTEEGRGAWEVRPAPPKKPKKKK